MMSRDPELTLLAADVPGPWIGSSTRELVLAYAAGRLYAWTVS